MATCLLLTLLIAPPARAADPEDAHELMSQGGSLAAEIRALDLQGEARLEEAFAIDPSGEHAGEARAVFMDVLRIIGLMGERLVAYAGIMAQIAAMDVSEETTTYAEQQYSIAQALVTYSGYTGELIFKYVERYYPEDGAELGSAGLERSDKQLAELATKMEGLREDITRQQQASQRYFDEHDIGATAEAGFQWTPGVAALLLPSASSLVCGVVARKKSRRVIGWGIFGFFVPIGALLFVWAVRTSVLEARPAPMLRPGF